MGKKSGFKQKKSSTRPISLQFAVPTISTKSSSKAIDLVAAGTYLQQAVEAMHQSQWPEVSRLAQLCIAGTHNNIEYQNSAKGIYAAALIKMGEPSQALALWQEIEKFSPNDVANLGNIGVALINLQLYDDAIRYFKRILTLQPNNISAYLGLGLAFSDQGDFEQSVENYQHALTFNPDSIDVLQHLAVSLWDSGVVMHAEHQIARAYQIYERILGLQPYFPDVLSSMLFMQSYQYPLDVNKQHDVLMRFSELYAKQDMMRSISKVRSHSPLRIGFVSADLRNHPVGYFLESTIKHINADPLLSNQVNLLAYHNSNVSDHHTDNLKAEFSVWHDVKSWSDQQLIEQIRNDKIDILIDLSGHTRGNRLSVFAMKAAPIQVSWLGYFGSTGLSDMDYVLADPYCVPAGEENRFLEKVWRLPFLRYCFSIPSNGPIVSEPPCLYKMYTTFGCFQDIRKINSGVLESWAKVLSASPDAHLRIQSKELKNSKTKSRFIERLNLVGIDVERVNLVDGMSRSDYLASYADVDILLDTFPYPGGTTTAEALWMGVPTLTLAMPSMLGRQGEALLVNAGLSDWIAHSEDEYVQKAIAWGNADTLQCGALAQLRAGMREQVRLTPVFNEKQFAQDFVAAMLAMWQKVAKAPCKNEIDSTHLNQQD